MPTRKIIDAKHNGEKVWLKSHAQATFMSDGATVEDTIKSMQTGSGGITSESDPIFSASPAFNITDENIENWNGKQDAILDLDEIRSGAGKGATAVQPSELARVATSGDYNDLNNKPAIPTKTSELTNDSTFITSTDNVASATKLQTMRYINGSPFDGTANAVSYAVCTTASATTAKTVSISRFSLATGSQVRVKFNYPNTASAPTLNVGSTGAKRMSYKGNLITNTNFTFNVNKIYTFTYDGTNWVLEGDWDEVPKTNFLTCEFMGEVGDVIWSYDTTNQIAIIHDWMNKLSEGKVSILESDEDIYAVTYALNYRSHETFGSGMAYFSYIFEGYLYEVEYDEVALPVTLTIVSKTKIGGEGGGNAEPMVCAYRITSYTANHIELENYTYNGQTMDYREGAIISILNPNPSDVVFYGGPVTLDDNEYEMEAFTFKSGTITLFSLGVDPGILFPISSVGGATTTNNKLPLEDTTITLEGNVLSGNVYVIPNAISSLSVDIIEPTDGVLVKDYIIHFSTGASVSSFSFPDELLWANGNAPTIEESTAYELSVVATSIGEGYVYKGVLTVFK